MNELILFDNFKVRTCIDATTGEPMFIAKDVFEELGIVWKGKPSLKPIREDWQGVTILVTPGGNQEFTVLNEQAVYKIAFRSKKASAEAFTDRVAEIVKQIRKTGKFEVVPMSDAEIMNRAFLIATKENTQLKAENTELKEQIQIEAPKVVLADKFLTSEKLFTMQEVGKLVKRSPQKLYALLIAHSILSTNKLPVQQYMEGGKKYFDVKIEILPHNGEPYRRTMV